MSPTEAAVVLRAIFSAYVRGQWRGGVKLADDVLVTALAAYEAASEDEQRSAYWAFQQRGVLLSETGPTPAVVAFLLGEGEDTNPLRIIGYDSGHRWNGWACPLVTHDGAKDFIAKWTEWTAGCVDAQQFRYDDTTDAIIETDPNYPEDGPAKSEAFWNEWLRRNLFDVGFGLCWTVRDATPEEIAAFNHRYAEED